MKVATVPTVYGIETASHSAHVNTKPQVLQQYLPFTVLKPLPVFLHGNGRHEVATVPTVYGIETL